MNEEFVRKRIEAVKKSFKWTENSLAKDPATQKRLNRQLSHGGTITLDTLLLILEACPEVSADWLLLGRGHMHLLPLDLPTGPHPSESPSASPSSTPDLFIQRLLSLLEQKDRQLDHLIGILSKK